MSVVELFRNRLEKEHYSTAFIRVLITAIEASERKHSIDPRKDIPIVE